VCYIVAKSYRIFLTFLIICALTFSVISPAIGSSQLDDIYNQQQQIDKKINDTETKIKQKEREKQKTLSELQALNRSMEKTTDEIDTLENKLAIAEKHIDSTQNEINIKETEVDERTTVFQNRLSQIYQQGDVNFLEVLFQSTSFSDFLTRFELLKKLAENDTDLLSILEAERTALEEKKSELENKKQELLVLKESKKKKNQQLQIASARRQTLVKKIEQQKEYYEAMLDELEKQSEQIAAEIRKLQSSGGERPGWLQWPTPGYYRITSPYGMRFHPILKINKFHTGVDIAAPYGSNAVAAANGTVIYTGWRGGYGHTIIVDHGGGMSTMYPHLSKYLVKVGDYVKRNQPVGKIGTSGWSTGPHIHFEVRINGEHVNPMPYLRK